MRSVLFILLTFSFQSIFGQDCVLNEIGSLHVLNLEPVQKIGSVDVVFTYNVESLTISVSSQSTSPGVIDLVQDNEAKTVHFTSNANLHDIDTLLLEPTDSPYNYGVTIKMECEGLPSNVVNIIQPIIDINTHPPKFENEEYALLLPMPLLPKWDLTSLGPLITATDIDFSNKGITFSVQEADLKDIFVITNTQDGTNKKNYSAHISVKNSQTFDKTTTLTIVATDAGLPAQTATAKLTISIDKDSSVPSTPTFSSSIYNFEYKDGKFTTAPEIKVTSDNPDITSVTASKDDNFEAVFDPATMLVTINITPLEKIVEAYHTLTLTASVKGNVASTTSLVAIKIANATIVPKFSKAYYTASYEVVKDGTDVIHVEGDITVDPDGADVKLVGEDYANNFSIVKSGTGWALNVEQDLEDTILKNNQVIILQLQATNADIDELGYATISVKLPEQPKVPKFSTTVYSGTYKINGDTAEVTLEGGNIEVVSESGSPKVEILGTYKDNFNIGFNSDDSIYVITVTKPLGDEVLKNTEITLTLQAAVDGVESTALATVQLKLPTIEIIIPRFSKPFYSAEYQVDEDGKGSLQITENIAIASDQAATTNVKVIEQYQDNFAAQKQDDHWTVVVMKELDLNDVSFKDITEIVVVLQASIENNEEEGLSSLVVKLPPAPIVITRFDKAYYNASYEVSDKEGGIDTITCDKIGLVQSDATVEIIGNFVDNFVATKVDDAWTVTVTKNLDPEILKQREIVLVLQANLEDAVDNGLASLVVKLPTPEVEIIIPKFSNAFYYAHYQLSTEGLDKITTDDIVLTSKNPGQTNVTLDTPKYNEYFAVTKQDTGLVVSVVKNLDSTTLSEEQSIILVLQAELEGAPEKGTASLVIELPTAPKFSGAYYSAQYQTVEDGADTIKLSDPIVVEPFATTVITVVDQYKDYIGAAKGENDWTLNVGKDLPIEVLQQDEVVVLLQATVGAKTSFASVILHLPQVEPIATTAFAKPYYTAQYQQGEDGKDQIILSESIVVTNNQAEDTVVVLVASDYSDNFETQKGENNQWTVSVKTNLDPTIIGKEKELVLILQATLTNALEYGEATLIIKLPDADPTLPVPKFSKVYYIANYSISDEGPDTVVLGDDIAVTTNQADTIVQITGNYSDNFEAVLEDSKWTIHVTKNLEGDDLANDEILLVLLAALEGAPENGQATLILQLPQDYSKLVPKFSSPFYNAEYTESEDDALDTVKLLTPIGVTNVDKIVFSDEYNQYFSIANQDDVWTISVIKNLNDEVLQQHNQVVAILQASNTELATEASLIIKLPTILRPKFSNPYYTAEYKVADNGDTSVTLKDKIGTTGQDSTIEVTGEYKDNFSVQKNEDNEWLIQVTNKLDLDNLDDEIVLVLQASSTLTEDTDLASIVLKLPPKEAVRVPKFSSPYYNAVYEKGEAELDHLNLLSDIVIASDNAAETVVKIEPSFSDYFEAQKDGDKWNVVVVKNLDDDIVDKGGEAIVVLQASLDGVEDQGLASLIIQLPSNDPTISTPKFTNAFYKAQYVVNDAENDTIDLIDKIALTSETSVDTEIQVTGTYSSNFEIVKDGDEWKINVVKDLDVGGIQEDEVVAVLEAKSSGVADSASASVIITLPSPTLATPKFNQTYYIGHYNDSDNPPTVDMEVNLFITSDNLEDVTINIIGSYSDNFKISYDEKWTIVVANPLTPEILTGQKELLIEIESVLKNAVSDFATLIIKLQEPSAATFDKAFYSGSYSINNENEAVIDLETPIKVSDNGLECSIVNDYTENFVTQVQDQVCIITVQVKLNDTVLQLDELVLTLEASKTGVDSTSHAIVVIGLPKQPQFSQDIYVATYNKASDGSGSISMDVLVQIVEPTDVSQVAKVTVGGVNKEYFDVVFKDDHWELTLQNKIPDTILDKESTLVLDLEVTIKGSPKQGSAGLMVVLPKAVVTSKIRFTKYYYNAKYTFDGTDGHIQIDGDIKLEADDSSLLSDVKLGYDEYKEYFELVYDKESALINVNVLKPLKDDILANAAITITVEVTVPSSTTDVASGSLIITLPKTVVTSRISFEKNYYDVNYKSDGTIEFDGVIQLQADPVELLGDVSFTFDEEYKEYFRLDYDSESGTVAIVVLKNLTDDILSKAAITVGFKATVKSSASDIASGSLIITLPKTVIVNRIRFEKSYYNAKYLHENPTDVLDFKDDIKLQSDDPALLKEVIFSYDEEYNEFIQLDYNSDTGTVTVTLLKNLIDDILSNAAITISFRASIESSTTDIASGSLIITLPKTVVVSRIKFEKSYYNAGYLFKDPIDTLEIDGDIKLQADDSALLGEASLTYDDEYKDYFRLDYDKSSGGVTVTVLKNLIDDVLKKSALTITFKATVTSSATDIASGSLIITLPKTVVVSRISFEKSHYDAKYLYGDPTASLQIDGDIKLQTEEPDLLTQATLTYDEEYKAYFRLDYSQELGTVTITVLKNLIDEILQKAAITIGFKVSVPSSTSDIASGSLIIILPKTVVVSRIRFDKFNYNAKYLFGDSSDTLEVDGDIKLESDDPGLLSTITFSFDDEYKEFIQLAYDNGVVSAKVVKKLTDDILNNAVITVDFNAVVTESSTDVASGSLIIVLPRSTNNIISFSSVYYTGEYKVGDDKDSVTHQKIDLSVKSTEKPKLVLTGDLKEYFDLSEDLVVTLNKDIPSDELKKHSEIILTVTATVPDTPDPATAALIIEVPQSENTGTLAFSNVYYIAEYDKDQERGDKIDFKPDIEIKSESTSFAVTIKGDYGAYFQATCKDRKITITLIKAVTEKILSDNSALVLTLDAKDSDTQQEIETALVVSLPKSDDDDDDDGPNNVGYIAAVSILAVLLAIILIGFAALYFLKLRKKSYKELEDTNSDSPKFSKNNSGLDSRKLEKPKRRATTGLVKYESHDDPDEDGGSHDSYGEYEPDEARRKSVAFDENVQKLQIDPKSDESNDDPNEEAVGHSGNLDKEEENTEL